MLTHNGVINGYQSGSRVKSLTRSLSISKDTYCDANFDRKMRNAQSMDTSRGAVFFSKSFFFPISKDTHCDANFDRKLRNAQSMDTNRGRA